MPDEISEFRRVMQQQGLHAALQYLNRRTPHRYTGVFRFDGEMLRNEALFDRLQPALEQGGDAPMAVTYCSLVGQQQAPLEIIDATTDARVRGLIDTAVVSYCGVLIRDAQGQPFGTLCHYDMQRCQERTTDQPLLEAAATLFYEQLQGGLFGKKTNSAL
ncbi:hypothetical protein [Hymenobacter psychrophilus]|uniref:GAF domain-containing protein n=1 Tax=Hymenobacter psychrophilus TaxID=651662 RepID=A0A1H3LRI8_9BACT|nr:hypothetical protein [Hymenobacter psychrophilus]SDY67001.1 hypothetical protein SAMN04488069_111101 [Hymenobacter psychrophilus]